MPHELYNLIGFSIPSEAVWGWCCRSPKYVNFSSFRQDWDYPNLLTVRLQECTICGKRVMALAAHLKVHDKRPENTEEFNQVEGTPSPSLATKSKRAAAHK